MKVKVSEATGPVLDYMVAKAEGLGPNTDPEVRRQYVGYPGFADSNGFGYAIKKYSTDGAQAVPIIEREKITADYFPDGGHPDGGAWLAYTPAYQTDLGIPLHEEFGPTFLIAAMRCFVASKLDDEVEVPDELA